jgi:hypothetical protein
MDRDHDSRLQRARRSLQLALGALWIVDGALQLQPFMLSRGFADHILQPAAAENPGWVSAPILYFAHLVASQPVLCDLLFGLIQLAIGLGLLLRRTVRPALIATVLWAVVVWYLGEGLGGILGAQASPFTGAPGAALLYALLALIAWPVAHEQRVEQRAARGARARRATALPYRSPASEGLLGRGAIGAWIALWGSAAYFLLQAGVGGLGVAQAGIFESAREAARAPTLAHWAGNVAYAQARGTGEPGLIAALDRFWATASAANGPALELAFAVVFALAAIAVLSPPLLARVLLALSIASAVVIWVVGENFGQILSGQGTDPNTGPLLILLAVAFWPLRSLREEQGSGAWCSTGRLRAALRERRRLSPQQV